MTRPATPEATQTRAFLLAWLIGVCALLTAWAPLTWLVLIADGLYVACVLVGAAGWGAWPARWLGLGRRPAPQRFCLAAALGLGVVSVLTLALGALGWLSTPAAWAILGVGALLGAGALARGPQAPSPACVGQVSNLPPDAEVRRYWTAIAALCGALLAVPTAIALLGACLPPGVLWDGEARGYDVLEYHLQSPREHFDQGRVAFLPHNVYASFPQQVEMLYLLLMWLKGDPHAAAIPAQLLHASLGALAALAALAWTRGPGRWVAAAALGSVPWVAYLGALAYVECGLLFFAAVATGLALDALRCETPTQTPGRAAPTNVPRHVLPPRDAPADWRLLLAAGLIAGLACGCKYTALVLVAAALGAAWLLATHGGLLRRLRDGAMLALGSAVAFSPWMIRNVLQTGNPVYPFAYTLFGGAAWSDAQAAQWTTAHALPESQRGAAPRAARAVRELFGSLDGEPARGRFTPSLFGLAIFVAGMVALLGARSRGQLALAAWAALMLAAWAGLTFMPGRFLVPLIVPLAFAVGAACDARPRTTVVLASLVLLGGAWNNFELWRTLREHAQRWQARTGVRLAQMIDGGDVFAQTHPLNALPEDARIWLVGDAAVFYVERPTHYTVVFSRDPWIEFAAGGARPRECVAWLAQRGVTHVAFGWSEIRRLRKTYGFAEIVTPEWVEQLVAAGLRPERFEASFGQLAIYSTPPAAGAAAGD